jgi:hypothetical protein
MNAAEAEGAAGEAEGAAGEAEGAAGGAEGAAGGAAAAVAGAEEPQASEASGVEVAPADEKTESSERPEPSPAGQA